ncbi:MULTISPECIES: hypothetical protein [unclassified Kitasatospora]|uniref:hypothetical protein n=1 Tax=unclassified Kitasatospora TaxID=2633591 RepID=UPI000AFD929C|nr:MULTISPECIES: hypothetical protein [unclassified Kitasatospora]
MPPRPRPLDPDDGPLQAFAYELRCLRQAAGNPSYRALAGTAGFSATTLSDAAGGVRRPTLDVTLAYVGACSGDVKLWEKRWYALDRRLAGSTGADARVRQSSVQAALTVSEVIEPTEADAENRAPVVDAFQKQDFEPEPVDGEEPGVPHRRLWRSRAWLPAMAVALVLVLTGLLVGLKRGSGDTQTVSGAGCPVGPAGGTTFQGLTYSGSTRVRSSASRSAPVIDQIPPGCTVQFVGFCIGDAEQDVTAGTPDVRWFKLASGGMVSSAVVHGNPPWELRPDRCPGEFPAPSSISLVVAPRPSDPEAVELRASGSYLGVVGFAGYFSDSGQAVPVPRWHQLGLIGVGVDGFVLPWRIAKPTADQGPIQLVAVACLGGDGPTDVLDALTVPPATPTQARPLSLGEGDRSTAARTACRYPA